MSDKENKVTEPSEETMEQQAEETKAADEKEAVDSSNEEAGTKTEDAANDTEKKGHIFGKKNKEVAKLEEKLAELEDKRVRQLAEFENFRKRSEKEKSQMFEVGAKSVIEKMLPVMDNFERGLAAVKEEEKGTPFVEGMELVYKQLKAAFEAMDVKPIEAVGKEFDPNLHNAVMMVDDDELESGMIAEELQKGYTYKDSVVRHSMVKVTN